MILQIVTGIFIYYVLIQEDIRINLFFYIFFNVLSYYLLNNNHNSILLLIPIFFGIIICDYKKMIIPDSYILLIIFNRIIYLDSIHLFIDSIINGAFILIFVLALYLFYKYCLNKESLGFGDVKLLFALSMYQNFIDNIICILISCSFALVVMISFQRYKIAFGPYICLAYLIIFVLNSSLIVLL